MGQRAVQLETPRLLRPERRGISRGFTLVEILVAATIIVIIAVILLVVVRRIIHFIQTLLPEPTDFLTRLPRRELPP